MESVVILYSFYILYLNTGLHVLQLQICFLWCLFELKYIYLFSLFWKIISTDRLLWPRWSYWSSVLYLEVFNWDLRKPYISVWLYPYLAGGWTSLHFYNEVKSMIDSICTQCFSCHRTHDFQRTIILSEWSGLFRPRLILGSYTLTQKDSKMFYYFSGL